MSAEMADRRSSPRSHPSCRLDLPTAAQISAALIFGTERSFPSGALPSDLTLDDVIAPDVVSRVRVICMALPEVSERLSHGAPAFFVGKQFVMLWGEGHHEHQFPHMWCAAPDGAQEELIAAEPRRFFRPPYVGTRGWVGMRLDGRVDWVMVEALCEDAYRTVAPARLLARLDSPADS